MAKRTGEVCIENDGWINDNGQSHNRHLNDIQSNRTEIRGGFIIK